MDPLPPHLLTEGNRIDLETYLKTLEHIRLEFMRYRDLEEEYGKLESVLQKH